MTYHSTNSNVAGKRASEERNAGTRDGVAWPRILMVTPRYPPYIGGVENHVYQVAHRLASAALDVTVLSTDPSGQLTRVEENDGVHVRRVPAFPAHRDYYFAPAIAGVIAQGRWDLVHVQSYHTLVAPLAMAAALRARIPYLVTFHGGGHSSNWRNAVRGAQQAALRPLLSRAARLIAIARFEIEYYGGQLGLPRERFALIPNGCDLPLPPSPPPVRRGLIVSIGRLERYKGHQRVIAALPHILRREPAARLWIAGSGPYEGELRKQTRALGVEDRVEIRAVPASERELLAAELSQASLVVLLSEFETQPIAVLEALALGRPVLAADTSGLHELAARGWIHAIPLQSTPEQVADAVTRGLSEPRRPAPLELPTWDQCARRLNELYVEVLEGRPCAS